MVDAKKEQQGRDNLANILTKTTNKLIREDEKKRTVKNQKTITKTQGWIKEAETEVNGKPAIAQIKEARIEEDGYERSITEITVGKTTKRYYDINNRELEQRIAETATDEEDRIEKYGDLPF